VYLGHSRPDGSSGLPLFLGEVLIRLFCQLFGALEVFRSGH
jgi:hypothetical protein